MSRLALPESAAYKRCVRLGANPYPVCLMAKNLFAALIVVLASAATASAQESFPFSSEMTLDAGPMRGSKRIPNIEIGQSGEVVLEMWCKGARGQFAVANESIVFAPANVDNRNCPADRAAADDALLASLTEATSWKRQGQDLILTGGAKPLRFRLNTN